MPISMLKYIKKYIKTLRHVSISTDHHQGVCLYLVKVTELNNCDRSHFSIHCNSIPSTTILNRRNSWPSNNAENRWTPMILKSRILRFHKN